MTLKSEATKASRHKSALGGGESVPLLAPIAEAFRNDASVTLGRMFSSVGLKVNGKVFAMIVKGDLVVKLSRQRVDALIASGGGRPFDPGHGRVMKEWVAATPAVQADWPALAQEARRFVAGE